jgi:tRNA G18 (ribose-2'-O)-methylase SpoU
VATIVAVRDADDPRLADYVRLTDIRLRKSLEAEHGLFVAEGEKVIRRALAAGYPPRSLLVTERRLPGVADLLSACAATAYVVPDPVAEQVTGFNVHRGLLASMARLPDRAVSDVLAGGRRVIVLEDIIDHTNVGAIFRCAAAFGMDAVVLAPRCADPLYRRAVRVSMGAVFAVRYARMTDWYGGLAELRQAGFRLLALTPDQSAVPIGAVATGERAALMLGAEGDGLSSRWLREADEAVCIPMAPGARTAGVDSLNVVAAAAIACHCFVGDFAGDFAGDGLPSA